MLQVEHYRMDNIEDAGLVGLEIVLNHPESGCRLMKFVE
jgi:hypothetical protein